MTAKISKSTGKTKADFVAKFSRKFVIPNKIRAALAELGPKGYEEQGEFLKRTGVTPVDLNAYKSEFDDHVIEARPVGGNSKVVTIWVGSASFASELQESLK